jgi:serine phosphatase RsbU (regulator of sigma subunit)
MNHIMKFDKRTIFFIVLSFFFLGFIRSQNLDSVYISIIKLNKSDTSKINALEKLTIDCFDAGEYKKCISVAKQGAIISQRNNKLISKGYFLHYIGKAYYSLSNFSIALNFYQQAFLVRESINDSLGMTKTLGNMGNTYYELSEYSKALEVELKCVKISEKINAKTTLKNALNTIGAIYEQIGEKEKSLNYYMQSLKYDEKENNKEGIAQSLGNIGKIYSLLGENEKALLYLQRSLNLAKEVDDKITVSNALSGLGLIYENKKDYVKALQYFMECKDICKNGEDASGVLSTDIAIANLYKNTGKLKEAEKILLESIKFSKEFETPEYELSAYSNLKDIYDKENKIDLAYDAFKKYIKLKDTINSDANRKELVKHEMDYEFEKKESLMKADEEKRAALAAAESKRQKSIIYGVSFGFLLVLILATTVYRNLQNNKKKNKIIEEQKAQVEKQKEIVEHKNKEIIDSINYAERIQRSFIATKELLDENLNDYFVFFKPKDIVSGDFYWASKLNNGNFALATADSTGHGVPGAIMSLLNVTSLEKAIENYIQPADILNVTRKIIIERLKKDGSVEGGKDGMDVSLTVYDFKTNKLIVAAANNPVWIIRRKEIIEIKPDKMPVGKHDKQTISFTQQEINLQKGDVVYTLTDGFPDQFGGEKGKKFMSKNLKELLYANAHLPMHEQEELLESTFKNWTGNLEQVDDITLIGIKV